MGDEFSKLNDLINVVTEIDARYLSSNLVIPEYQSLSWVDLCDKGIELLKKLRDE